MRQVRNSSLRAKLIGTVFVAALVSACSSDSMRFSGDPFTNPFSTRSSADPSVTNSVNRAQNQARATGSAAQKLANAPTARVATQAIPAPTRPTLAAPGATAAVGAAATGAVAGSNYPALSPVPPASPIVTGSTTGWSAVGGTPVTLQPGENVSTLSQRYGVPVSAILAVNGLSGANAAQPGQQLIIPSYNPAAVGGTQRLASRTVAPAAQPIPAPRPPAKVESEAEKRAAAKLKPAKPAPKPAADDDDDEDEAPVKAKPKTADAKKKDDARLAEAKKLEERKREEARKAEAERKLAAAKKEEARKAARVKPVEDEPATTASIPETKPAPKVAARPAEQAVVRPEPKPAEAPAAAEAESGPTFRWPAQGRVISGFGARGTGGANDGINIALPEGSPVRAAESGTVVHADDALKGYGKLVLIRHANGYVSVYAHNGELNVKRGESVKRGQVIAKSGQTGNVTSPQLHFEIRKGATPVDPSKYLASN